MRKKAETRGGSHTRVHAASSGEVVQCPSSFTSPQVSKSVGRTPSQTQALGRGATLMHDWVDRQVVPLVMLVVSCRGHGTNLHFFFHERSSLILMPSRMWSILYEMRISPSFCSDEAKVKSRQVAGE
jgi:hypothetical protein